MKAVIIAAGQSSRLWKKTNRTPKTLLPFGEGTILSTIIKNIKSCGIDEFVLVVGWKKGKITRYVKNLDGLGVTVEFVENPDWRRGNGISVLAASRVVGDEPFILSMCDHIVSPAAVSRLAHSPSSKNLLLVDRRIDDIFDIDDATKVRVRKSDIVQIGKELKDYNGIDCGVFRLDGAFFEAMRTQLKTGSESISAGVTGLIQQDKMGALFMESGERWIDIDTPEAYRHAVEKWGEFSAIE